MFYAGENEAILTQGEALFAGSTSRYSPSQDATNSTLKEIVPIPFFRLPKPAAYLPTPPPSNTGFSSASTIISSLNDSESCYSQNEEVLRFEKRGTDDQINHLYYDNGNHNDTSSSSSSSFLSDLSDISTLSDLELEDDEFSLLGGEIDVLEHFQECALEERHFAEKEGYWGDDEEPNDWWNWDDDEDDEGVADYGLQWIDIQRQDEVWRRTAKLNDEGISAVSSTYYSSSVYSDEGEEETQENVTSESSMSSDMEMEVDEKEEEDDGGVVEEVAENMYNAVILTPP